MGTIIAVEGGGMLACWAVAAYAIWKWGPGVRKRSVRCPEKKLKANVLANHREAEFACIRATDVKACSLLPTGGVLTCSKACLARL